MSGSISTNSGDGTKVIVVTYVMLAVTICTVTFRFTLTTLWKRKLRSDDYFLFSAVAIAIAETVLTQMAAVNGLGTFIRPGNIARQMSFAKFVYASDLLFLITLAASKLSVVNMLRRIMPDQSLTKRFAPTLYIAIALWLTFSLPAIAFQCKFSHPWLYVPSRCVASGSLWYPVLLTSVLLHIVLSIAAWPERRLLSLLVRQVKSVQALFASRIIVCIVTIIQLALLAPSLRSDNQSKSMLIPTVMRQLVMNLSILTAATLALYQPLATIDQLYLNGMDAKELSDASPPSSSCSSKKFGFGVWKSKLSSDNAGPSHEETASTPKLTLSFTAFNEQSQAKSRSIFSEVFTDEKTIFQRFHEWDLESKPNKQQNQKSGSLQPPPLSYRR